MKYFLFISFLLISSVCVSQDESEQLDFQLIVASHNDKVILRWAPANERSWLNWSGVNIAVYRRPLDKSGNDEVKPLELVQENITAWAESDYETYANQDFREDSLVMLAGFLMHAPYETTGLEMTMQNMVDRKEELANRYSTALYAADMNSLAAEALAMRTETVNAKESAYYTVMVTWQNGEQSNRTIRFDPKTHLIPQAGKIRGKELEKAVTLSWEQAYHKKHFTAYWIERSKDGDNWNRLNDIPFVHAFDSSLPKANDDYIYVDSVGNYNPHYYRIIGISPFGIESKPSASIQLQGRDRTPPASPDITEAIMKNATSMTISWEHVEASEDLQGFVIKRDAHHDGDFVDGTKLLAKDIRSFNDLRPNYLSSNFYKVCAVDTAGNQACSMPKYGFINDTIPPEKPLGLIGKIDTAGIVNLSWNNNSEIDLSGYHVYVSNRRDGVFSKLTEVVVKTNQFADTLSLNTLTEDIYYAITAEDLRSNVSVFSDRVQLMKPDTIPPGPAVFKSFKNNENGIYLSWNQSSSRDAVKQSLWRSTTEESKLIAEFDLSSTEYHDAEVQSNIEYLYEIITEDDNGNKTVCPNPVKLLTSGLLNKPIINLEKTEDMVNYLVESDQSLDKVVIYKSIEDKPFITYKTFSSKKEAFPFKQEEKASYKAIAITKQGVKSDASIIKIN